MQIPLSFNNNNKKKEEEEYILLGRVNGFQRVIVINSSVLSNKNRMTKIESVDCRADGNRNNGRAFVKNFRGRAKRIFFLLMWSPSPVRPTYSCLKTLPVTETDWNCTKGVTARRRGWLEWTRQRNDIICRCTRMQHSHQTHPNLRLISQ